MSTQINITVDTQEMAQTLNGVSSSVNSTTAAVGIMQGLVINEERKSTQNICAHVDDGFFMLVQSQVSQKLAAQKSIVDSRVAEISQQMKVLAGIQNLMRKDYQKITSRYSKLFSSLNSNLTKRVSELDKTSYQLGAKSTPLLIERSNNSAANYLVYNDEHAPMSIQSTTSIFKKRISGLFHSINYHLQDHLEQTRKIKRVTKNQNLKKAKTYFSPFVVVELKSGSSHAGVTNVHTPDEVNLDLKIKTYFEENEKNIKINKIETSEVQIITSEYLGLVDGFNADPRIKEKMKAFLAKTNWDQVSLGES
jgi:hypothetical protein